MSSHADLIARLRADIVLGSEITEAADAIEAMQAECDRLRGHIEDIVADSKRDMDRLREERDALSSAATSWQAECWQTREELKYSEDGATWLAAELAAAQKDAERYRWIRDNCEVLDVVSNREIDSDSAIDAAMAQEKRDE